VFAGVAIQRAGLIPTIVGMGVIYVAVTIAMFFNPALRGMDIRHGAGVERAAEVPSAEDGATTVASRAREIHR
jgi:hypothetical protein